MGHGHGRCALRSPPRTTWIGREGFSRIQPQLISIFQKKKPHETREWHRVAHVLVTSCKAQANRKMSFHESLQADQSGMEGETMLTPSNVSWSARGTGGLCTLGEQLSHPNSLQLQGQQKEGFCAASSDHLRMARVSGRSCPAKPSWSG